MSSVILERNIIFLSSLFILLVGILGGRLISRRSAKSVLIDLSQHSINLHTEIEEKNIGTNSAISWKTDFTFTQILTESEIRSLIKLQRLHLVIGSIIGVLTSQILFKPKPLIYLLSSFLGLCCGYLYSHKKLRNLEDRFKKDIIFFLPVVMERVVMAVQAGLDILPALKVIEEIEGFGINPKRKRDFFKVDVVTRLLSRVIKLCESGLSFEQSLKEVANLVNSNALRHCFIHLAVAQKEGGELVYPLRELSDATQLYFQDSIEEDIAKMPVKATMPLLLTFAGLIISFMTGPVIQILNISVNPKMISDRAKQQQDAPEVQRVQK